MGGADAGGPETSSYQLGTAAKPGLGGTCQKCGQYDYCLNLKRKRMGELYWLDVEEEGKDEASSSMCSKRFQVP